MRKNEDYFEDTFTGTCPECEGSGEMECPVCEGVGGDDTSVCCNCNGSGGVVCTECDGTGEATYHMGQLVK